MAEFFFSQPGKRGEDSQAYYLWPPPAKKFPSRINPDPFQIEAEQGISEKIYKDNQPVFLAKAIINLFMHKQQNHKDYQVA